MRVIRESKTDRVALPWMAFEERLAQYVLDYTDAYRAAESAHRALGRMLPQQRHAHPILIDPAHARKLWDARLREVVDVIPTPPDAFREGMRRESNRLPPAKVATKHKGGARDVAIWLTAVEYAHSHPEEKVYFVSANKDDFTNGKGPYPAPMDADRERAGANFIHLTALSDVLELLAPPVEVNVQDVEQRLRDCSEYVQAKALTKWGGANHGQSSVVPALRQSTETISQVRFDTKRKYPFVTKLLDVSDVKAYVLGEDTWCTAQMTWQFIGEPYDSAGLDLACCTWTSHVMLSLTGESQAPQIFDPKFPEATASGIDIDWPEKRVRHYSTSELVAAPAGGRLSADDLTQRFDQFVLEEIAEGPGSGTIHSRSRLSKIRRLLAMELIADRYLDADFKEREIVGDYVRDLADDDDRDETDSDV